MFSIITRAQRNAFALSASRAVQKNVQSSFRSRALHLSPVASAAAKKQEDLGELFSVDEVDQPTPNYSASEPSSSTISTPPAEEADSRRDAAFNLQTRTLKTRILKRRKAKGMQVRQSVWLRLMQVAYTPQQLEAMTDLFPLWRTGKKQFMPIHAEAFVRRCDELKCPQLALKVFGNHPKYGFPLSSQFAAQHLLHSLQKCPIEDLVSAAALFGVYGHPPVSSDLISSAILTSACLHHNSKNSLALADALVPDLKQRLTKSKPIPVPREHQARARHSEKPKMWLRWSLGKIEKQLEDRGEDVSVIRDWRMKSGYIPAGPHHIATSTVSGGVGASLQA